MAESDGETQEHAMDTDALDIVRQAFWLVLILSAPVLIVGLVVGLIVSVVQAVTQLQEQTLVFIPKIVSMIGVSIFVLSWLTAVIMEFATELFTWQPGT
jgi:flagellar biosynthesis protein FliQ